MKTKTKPKHVKTISFQTEVSQTEDTKSNNDQVLMRPHLWKEASNVYYV